ncbi:hypothetical protein FNO01nite_00420 [Flavobacterium noncentrifugens]|uniref:Peptidase M56 domain-containing protein n=1 Tax=Flavobacterium noncentrifugens TaxID=1128970 RepID=A0A1G8RBQ2_9FLAO|nr:hypothetical protein [Flavobacterium noncentrifugens]GEP49370.1 hypothetical protein FNO01nite_00420 [Flavobacterium noncentrifugens]SDJ14417.1 hypothetical protein SAMN04487935_0051 [Flavobacterium noncentrifugens]
MFLIVSKYLIPKGYRGMTVFPFVILRERKDAGLPTLMNHERIHIRQQLELLIVPFFIWYFLEYLVRLVQYKDRFLAYRNICFEREAYANESDFEYFKHRKTFAFLKFV